MTSTAATIRQLAEAIAKTDQRIILRAWDLETAHPSDVKRLESLIRRMEANNAARDRLITDLASREITGKKWAEYVKTIGGTYRPSVDASRFSAESLRVFCATFSDRFGREPYVYRPARAA